MTLRVSGLLEGLAQWLHDEGLATYSPTGIYPADGPVISLKTLPSEPAKAVSLSVYDMGDGLAVPDAEILVQLRFRDGGTRTAVDDFADDVFARLHMRHSFLAGGIAVSRARRTSTADLGPDSNNRFERADNYALAIVR
ncbi:phage tail terminator protein [Timonella sp. A28]|uniref:phage tail terminator protein n=1 Tax=Timonella sp. A28 TaxID=3442640 RepID=UPI003EC0AED3